VADLRRTDPTGSVAIVELDLGSLASVARCAGAIAADHPQLHLLVNNAGVMATPRTETADGFELQLGTNHLGHFALTAQLMPALLAGGPSRVVSVTSTGRHYRWLYDADDLALRRRYEPWRAYGRSKIANVHFAVELDRRLRAAGSTARSLVAHPGFANTDLQAASSRSNPDGRSQRFFHAAVRRVGMSPERGALPQLRAATDPDADGGQLFAPRWVTSGPPVRRPLTRWSVDPRAMAELWRLSEQETGTVFDVPTMVGTAL
jgi:NAD(P)-dependent dehydrogenase (short-subunit alcohol dehydrogenase family)